MSQRIDPELIAFAEQRRQLLPEGFLADVDALQSHLARGQSILEMREKGLRRPKSSNARIRAAVLHELSLFLCSTHPRYDDLRNQGKRLTKDSITFIAGVVVGTLGITSGMATGCVAFVALACLRVGVGAFCRLNPPERADERVQES